MDDMDETVVQAVGDTVQGESAWNYNRQVFKAEAGAPEAAYKGYISILSSTLTSI